MAAFIMFRAYFFDLDGTLLDTLPDLHRAVNASLLDCGLSYSFSKEETKSLLGYGTDVLVHRALGKLDNPELFASFKANYIANCARFQNENTHPFPGMEKALKGLKEKGALLFVVTNKRQVLAKTIVPSLLGEDTFDGIQGIEEGINVKPSPDTVNFFLRKYNLKPEECVYVGDCNVDIDTARNAKMKSALVLWGYGDYQKELKEEADYLLARCEDLLLL